MIDATFNGSSRAAARDVRLEASRAEQGDLDLRLDHAAREEQVVVTAADRPQRIDEVGKAITVLSQADFDLRQQPHIPELLRTVPGVQVISNGGPGQLTQIRLRGLRADATAILVDGLRFRDAASTQGDAVDLLSGLYVVNADRIETLRGSASSLYGTNATGGVVNIVSHQGAPSPLGASSGLTQASVQIEAGQLGLSRGRATSTARRAACATARACRGSTCGRRRWRRFGAQHRRTGHGRRAVLAGHRADGTHLGGPQQRRFERQSVHERHSGREHSRVGRRDGARARARSGAAPDRRTARRLRRRHLHPESRQPGLQPSRQSVHRRARADASSLVAREPARHVSARAHRTHLRGRSARRRLPASLRQFQPLRRHHRHGGRARERGSAAAICWSPAATNSSAKATSIIRTITSRRRRASTSIRGSASARTRSSVRRLERTERSPARRGRGARADVQPVASRVPLQRHGAELRQRGVRRDAVGGHR